MADEHYLYDLDHEPGPVEYIDPSGLDDDDADAARDHNHDHGLYDLDAGYELDYCTDHIAAVLDDDTGNDVLLRRTEHGPWVVQLVAVKRRPAPH